MKAIRSVLEWYRQEKQNVCCKKCGFAHPAAIEFHHRDPTEKRATISFMVHNGYDMALVKQEMAKCDPVCKNCHAIIHYG